MANIEYNSGSYITGEDFVPTTGVNKKVTLKNMNVSGTITIPQNTSNNVPLTLEGPAYTFTGSETFDSMDIVVNPNPSSKAVVKNDTEAYLSFQIYAQGVMTLNGAPRYVDGSYTVKVTLNLTPDQLANLTLDQTFTPFIDSHSNGAVVAINTVYTPVVNIVIDSFEIGAKGLSDIDVVLAI